MTDRHASVKAQRRAEKKQLHRQRLEEQRRREQRARFFRTFGTLVVISMVAAVGVSLLLRSGEPERPSTLPGELRTEPPWGSNTERLAERLDVLDLPDAGDVQHEHANLRIFVHGEPVTVPVDIGLDGDLHAPLRTHDELGTIHVESAERRAFTLGDFFDVWGVRLTDRCLGGSCVGGDDQLRAFVGGTPIGGNLRELALSDQAVIVLAFGTSDELPDPIPTTFDFGSVQG
jgi:hypothetical protein